MSVKILGLSLLGVAAALCVVSQIIFSRPLPSGREQYLRGNGDASKAEAREASNMAHSYDRELVKLDRGGQPLADDEWLGRRADAKIKIRSYSHLAELARDRADEFYAQAELLRLAREEHYVECNRLALAAALAALPFLAAALLRKVKGNKTAQSVTHPKPL